MTALRRLLTQTRQMSHGCADSALVFLRDAAQGLLAVSRSTLALLGLVAVAAVLFVGSHADLRQSMESEALDWLKGRHEARIDPAELLAAELSEPDAVARATAAPLTELTRQQVAVAIWISRRYRVAPEPISRLVKEAWSVGTRANIDPTLILAIMAIESSFNPFAQSSVGAQGLMQVMTRVHDDKYQPFGGNFAAFDPVTNLRVGAQVLKDCIRRAGSIEAGLRYYVGASNLPDDGGYASKVLAEQSHLRLVASGKAVSITATRPIPVAAPPKPSPEQIIPVKADEAASPEQLALLQPTSVAR